MMNMNGDPLPPAFFPVGLNLVGRRCVVIGNDHEAVEKEAALRSAGADDVRWFKDSAHVTEDDLREAFFVISTPQDEHLSSWLRNLADRHGFLLCAIDQPRYGFVAMAAIVSAGPVRVAISTGGVAPRVGRLLREALQHAFDETFVSFIEALAAQKRANRARIADSAERRKRMIAAASGFTARLSLSYPSWFHKH